MYTRIHFGSTRDLFCHVSLEILCRHQRSTIKLLTEPCIASCPLLLQAALAELNGLLLSLAVPAVLNSLLLLSQCCTACIDEAACRIS